MNRQFMGQTAGSIYDAAFINTNAKYEMGRMPQLGDFKEFDDGRKFRFVSSKIALTSGEPVSVATAADAELACTAAAVGATSVELTSTSQAFFGGAAGVLAADRLAGGYLVIQDDTGEGYIYRIKSNTAGTALVKVTVTLYDPLVVAVDATSDVVVIGPKYRLVVAGAAALVPVGVATVAVAGTDEYYFWVQTKGPAAVNSGGTSIGAAQKLGTANVVDQAEADVYTMVVGRALSTAANGSACVDLTIE